MYREPVNSGYDHKVFNQTARKTKDINVRPHVFRGGIRL